MEKLSVEYYEVGQERVDDFNLEDDEEWLQFESDEEIEEAEMDMYISKPTGAVLIKKNGKLYRVLLTEAVEKEFNDGSSNDTTQEV